jgi:exopolysaccharide production protein ExoQ
MEWSMGVSGHLGKTGSVPRSNTILSIVMVYVIIIQQGAFVSIPIVVSNSHDLASVNPLNTAAVAVSLGLIVSLCISRAKDVTAIMINNIVPALFAAFVLASAVWSTHPDASFRGAVGYLLTILICAYSTVRFSIDQLLKLLSLGFVVSGLASIIFAVVFPQYGITQEGELGGTWRGVFAHKEQLGAVMVVAVFTEVYILSSGCTRWLRRLACVLLFISLIVLSDSKTALLLALLYLIGAGIYLVWRHDRLLGWNFLAIAVIVMTAVAIILLTDPEFLFGIIGKDVTLTGRTGLWRVVFELISQKPILGWGYHAVWQQGDPVSVRTNEMVGGWSVPSAHNGGLGIALELGWVGLALLVLMVGGAVWRGLQCCARGINPLGWFSTMFFAGLILSSQTLDNLGQNQVIEWVVFNILLFRCGTMLRSIGRAVRTNSPSPRLVRIANQ